MALPNKEEAHSLLEKYVQDEYQLYHGKMVGTAMGEYAKYYGENEHEWYLTGLLHDIDFEQHPDVHPAKSLEWFKEWNFPESLIHSVEAHAYGYNGFTTLPQTKQAAALMACDEISGIFYAYKKLNPIPYGEMKASSIQKRLKEKAFAAKIERETIYRGCEALGVTVEEHVSSLIKFLKDF